MRRANHSFAKFVPQDGQAMHKACQLNFNGVSPSAQRGKTPHHERNGRSDRRRNGKQQ